MLVPFVYKVHATLDGTVYVSDGALLVRADRVAPQQDPAGVREIAPDAIRKLLARTGGRPVALSALTPSRVVAGGFRAPDETAFGGRYIELLRALGPVDLVTDGPQAHALVRDRGVVIGALMPVAAAPELGSSTASPRPAAPTYPQIDSFYALQSMHLLGEFDGGTWARHIGRVFGRDFTGPLTESHVHELLFRARREDGDLEHTQGHSARLEGIFLARELEADEPARVVESVRKLAAQYDVTDVTIEDPHELDSIFVALGRAFSRAKRKERVFKVGDAAPFLLIREALRAVPPLSPVRAYDPAGDPSAPPPPGGVTPGAGVATTSAPAAASGSACPICDHKVSPAAEFCPACRVGLARTPGGKLEARPPDLKRGAPIVAWDFRAAPPPGCSARSMTWGPSDNPTGTLAPHPDGVLYEGRAPRTATLREPLLRLRSGCVRFAFTTMSGGARVGLAVRDEPIGAASVGYVLDLVPSTGTLFFARLVTSPTTSAQIVLVSRTVQAPYLRPMGEPNELEVRMDGGWLIAHLNGAAALRTYDPAYGIGAVGLRVGTDPDAGEPPSRIVLRQASVHALEASR